MPEGMLRVLAMADAVAIHLGLALVIGSLASQAWLWQRTSAWTRRVGVQATRARQVGFALSLAGVCLAIWFEAAAMSELPLLSAGPALVSLIGKTHYGHASIVGLAAWLTGAGLLLGSRRAEPRVGTFTGGLLAVAVFVGTRSVVSHAGSQGDFTLDVAADWVHLTLVCLWVGIVLVGARLVLPDDTAPDSDRADATRWVSMMSTSATVAIVAIGATGLFKVWRGWATVGPLEQYLGSDYGKALLVKLALVAFAAALGGINRFLVLPGFFRNMAAALASADGSWRRRLLVILRIEAVTLFFVLTAAALLSSSELPSPT